jgi:hypothetical protein
LLAFEFSYKPLLFELNGNCKVIYAARTGTKFAKAETCFQRMLTQEFNPGELLHHLQVRKQAEEKQFQRMTQADVRDWQQGAARWQ